MKESKQPDYRSAEEKYYDDFKFAVVHNRRTISRTEHFLYEYLIGAPLSDPQDFGRAYMARKIAKHSLQHLEETDPKTFQKVIEELDENSHKG